MTDFLEKHFFLPGPLVRRDLQPVLATQRVRDTTRSRRAEREDNREAPSVPKASVIK
ncbi:MAG: hypothetical protein ACOCW6_09215 [Spirochaetota bacterium]